MTLAPSRNWLVPVDGSEVSLRPIDWLIAHRDDWVTAPTIHLLNVQAALTADASRFINADQIKDFHREEGLKALAEARQRLEAAGFAPQCHVTVGDSADTIVDFATSRQCDQILMGTRGHTGLGGTLLGSVASKVAHKTQMPLLLVR
jgi:nucleotide-binding universal stress UspA family protein